MRLSKKSVFHFDPACLQAGWRYLTIEVSPKMINYYFLVGYTFMDMIK